MNELPFFYNKNLAFVDLASIELDNIDKTLTSKSYKKVVEPEDIFHTDAFKKILSDFISDLRDEDSSLFDFFSKKLLNTQEDLVSLTSLSLYVPYQKIVDDYPQYKAVLEDHGSYFLRFFELFYKKWLSIERFCLLRQSGNESISLLKKKMFLFREAILQIYYNIKNNFSIRPITIENNLAAGFTCGFSVCDSPVVLPTEYDCLQDVSFISGAFLNIPYSTFTKRNKRIGVYEESKSPIISSISINPKQWLCIPFFAGSSLVYFYFNIRFTNNVLGVINLFQKADISECKGKKPDALIVFGGDKDNTTGTYYHDEKNDIMVGYVSNVDDADYFGYVKKLILTLHNIRMIKNGNLPIHGSMVNIVMKYGQQINVVIMGDSGAGKSESIESFRQLAKEYLKDIKVIFDDMGTLFDNDGNVVASGTETGAFVRIDDLEMGYAFSHMNDSIMYNLDKQNARIVYQCTPYSDVIKKWSVDIFLYANNYENNDSGIKFFNNYEDLVNVCEEGKRKAKGTTGEIGLVKSYFANPFGPVQNKEATHSIVMKMFKDMARQGTKIGTIYTQLAVDGKNKTGPQNAAKHLFDWINQNKKSTNN